MHSWSTTEVPSLPGKGLPLRLYDTATDEISPTAPGETARMYVCGITPYDATHLGHAATYVTFDLVHRLWLDAGHQVDYVQNVTDIDDPLLERAERDGTDWVTLGQREIALFRADMEALRVLPPKWFDGATEVMGQVADAVGKLLADGSAYTLDDGTGDVYFDVQATSRFGYESRYDEATMLELFAERGGDPDRTGKRGRLDPLLWRGRRDGEPFWPSELGAGRPGWHIECSVIAQARLGSTIDLQGGGSDLRFPHHEMSAAHAEASTGEWPFARHYVHSGMMGLDGAKMSKSKGNLVLVSRLRADEVDPMAVRLGLLTDHYRSDRDWTDEKLREAGKRLATWREAAARSAGAAIGPVLERLRERLADDLDTPAALRAVDRWARQTLDGDRTDEGAPALLTAATDALLGVRLH